MKCLVEGCKAETRTLSTRGTKRRRECFNGHRFSTVEVPAPPRRAKTKQVKHDL